MVINREFYFRGWLPAGLVLNARLIERAATGNFPVMVPVLNPYPGSGWSMDQPQPVFPVTQASSQKAILLRDPFPESTLVLLPLKEWMGSGTPMILAANTWYDGRIQEVSGADVMAIRLRASADRKYYSYYSELTSQDIAIKTLPARMIVGKNCETMLFGDVNDITLENELGVPPMVSLGGQEMSCRLMHVMTTGSVNMAGMATGFKELNPGTARQFIQCKITSGRVELVGDYKTFGIGSKPDTKVQSFYTVQNLAITAPIQDDDLDKEGIKAVVARGSASDEQVVHYN